MHEKASNDCNERVGMSELPLQWYAIYTRSRHEKQVDLQLRRHRLETFLPLQRSWSTRQDRRVQIEMPALPGYLFVRCALWPDTRALIKRSTGVIRVVESVGRPAVIPAAQVLSLRKALEQGNGAANHPYLQVGDWVRVLRGPMADVEGRLVRMAGDQHKLVINVDFVQQAVAVHVDARDVEKIEPPRRAAK